MRLALLGLLLAVTGLGRTVEFGISIPQPLHVRQPFNVVVTPLSNDPRPPSQGTFTLDGQPFSPVGGSVILGTYSFVCQDEGIHELGFHFAGDSHYEPSSSYVAFEVLPKIPTSVTPPTANPPNPAAGQPFVLSTFADAEGGVPGGYVGFFDSGSLLAIASSENNHLFTATVKLGIGQHILTAAYVVTGGYEGSTSLPLNLAIAKSATSLLPITISGVPRFGQPLTIATKITPAANGPVTFFDGTSELGTVLINPDGSASVTSTTLAIGSHDISARYSGTPDFAPSATSVVKQVIKGLPTLVVSSDRNPSPNQPVTFTATLTSPSAVAPAPTGDIVLREGSATLATVPVKMTFTATLPAGNHTIIATYSGDALYEPATSAPFVQRVTGAAPTTTKLEVLLSDTAQIKVTVSSNTGTTPTGSVQLNTTPLNLANGTATLPDAKSLLGRRVTAAYSGDAAHAASSVENALVLAPLNGFSFAFASFAPSELVTVFGDSLAGATVRINDQPTTLYFSGDTQATFAMPANLADGSATLTITNAQGQTFTATLTIVRTAPGLATISATGEGLPAGQLLRLRSGSQRTELLTGPIVFNGDEIYLILYGTGFRNATGPVTCKAGNITMTAAYAGPQGDFDGLDQINLPLDAALRNAGNTSLTCTANGLTSNSVALQFP